MNVGGRKVLLLGGYGLVGIAVCRELLARKPGEIQIHSLRQEESAQARQELLREAGDTKITVSHGDILGLAEPATRREGILAQLKPLDNEDLPKFLLYRLLTDARPDIVIDCVNTATAIAYRDIFKAAQEMGQALDGSAVSIESAEELLDALNMPRLIRHIQILYRGMTDAGTAVYIKVGTSGTGGMGLNVPYTHSEEKPSRVLLSKSALAGAHTMLLFLMARTPGGPITKEIKPAAAIAWKRIGHGPIYRNGQPIRLLEAQPLKLGPTFSTLYPQAAVEKKEILEAVYIDTGENGIFSLEEFAMLTTSEQMEFVTPEEIARSLIFEIEGGNTGHDVVNALDNAVLGPTYRAGLLRHWAMERMNELQNEHGTHSVAFEMLGPPRNSKLLFEAHLLGLAFGRMSRVRSASPDAVADALDELVRKQPQVANEVVSVGIPILFRSGELLRGPRVIVPPDAKQVTVTQERIDAWAYDGWVDLRIDNCARWIERFQKIHEEIEAIPEDDTSSRFLRTRRFWADEGKIQPGKIVGWILSVEEEGARFKG